MATQAHDLLPPTVLVLATVLLVFGMKYMARTRQARLRFAGEDSFRSLAENAAAAQPETSASLAATRAELFDVKARLTSIEKMLREVG